MGRRVALVTGGTRGYRRGHIEGLREAGYSVCGELMPGNDESGRQVQGS